MNKISNIVTDLNKFLLSYENNCFNCTKRLNNKGVIVCAVLNDYRYPFLKYGKCWSWSDNYIWKQYMYYKNPYIKTS